MISVFVRSDALKRPKTPRDAPSRPKIPHDAPKTPPRHLQDAPKSPPRRSQDAPRTPPRRSKTPQDAPRQPKTALRRLQDVSKTPQGAPKTREFHIFWNHCDNMRAAALAEGLYNINVQSQECDALLMTCRSRVICKKSRVTERHNRGTKRKLKSPPPAQKKREALFFAPGATSIFALCPDCAAP